MAIPILNELPVVPERGCLETFKIQESETLSSLPVRLPR